MAVGSAIAAVVTSALFKKIAINLVIAVATSFVAKKLGLFKPPKLAGGNQRDQGVKIQLPPSTDNKIPVLYGRNLTGGIITHAELVNQNKTMRYVMVMSEAVPGANYSVNRVFRNDVELTVSNLGIVTGGTTRDGDAVPDIANKMRVYVYADGTGADKQIYPVTGTPAAATTRTGELTANTSMEGLVYLIFELDYDPEASLFDSGIITVDLENDVVNPADVLIDYLTNSRYGAGLAPGALDIPSFDNFRAYCDESVTRQDSSGTEITTPRWRINGGLSTFNTALENIQAIVSSSSGWFTYNPSLGKYTIKINGQATQTVKDNALVFNDDNIVSKVDVSTTELYSLFNEVEAEYEDVNLLDQTNVVYVKTPAEQRKPGEPDNTLSVRYTMINDLPRARNLANIELRQSRFDKVVRFTSDYSGIQLLSGDIFKLSNPSTGFDNKLFRCLRTLEVEDESGRLLVEVTGLEYDDTIYDHSTEREVNPAGGPGIPIFVNNPDLGNVQANAIANIAANGFVVGQIPPSVIDGLPETLANLNVELSDAANAIDTLSNVTIPGLEDDLEDLSNTLANTEANVSNLTGNIIPDLETDLANTAANVADNANAITTLTTFTLPALEQDLSDNSNAIEELNNVTIVGLQNDLSNLDSNLSTLDSQLGNLDTELGNLSSELSVLDGKFPITETDIANDSITTPKIFTNAVIAQKIAANAVIAEKIAANAVTAEKIFANAVTTNKIDALAVTTDKIAANAITAGKIAANAVTANEIAAGTITGEEIGANTITANNIDAGTITGDKIAAGTITSENLEANVISGNVIAANSITSLEIATDTILANNIQFATITGDRIAGNTITANNIGAGTITALEIGANTITANNIQFGTITGDRIASNTVLANNIFTANLAALSTSTGTLFVDTLTTSANTSAQRIRLTGIQDDATYALWSGANAVTDANASFYVKHNGDAKFSGRVRAAQLEGAFLDAVPVDVVGNVLQATSNTYVTICNVNGEVPTQTGRPRRPFMMVSVPVFGPGSPTAFLRAQIQIEDPPGSNTFGSWTTVSQELGVNTDGAGSAVTLAGGLDDFGEGKFKFRVQFRRVDGFTYTGSPEANRYNGLFIGLPTGSGVSYTQEDANVAYSAPANITANSSVLIPPNFEQGWTIEP